jgi:ligand-binding sensor protein
LFATYQDAFRSATGLPLRLVSANLDNWCLDSGGENLSPFCARLNLCNSVCRECIETNRRLMAEAAVHGPTTCQCFAGMSATAVPVQAEGELIGFLKTGQVFTRVPEPEDFERVRKVLSRASLDEEEIAALGAAYQQTRRIEPERYQSMITLLATFARQLGQHAEKIVAITEGREPAGVTRARDFIAKNLSEPLPLPLVAAKAGLSESHF